MYSSHGSFTVVFGVNNKLLPVENSKSVYLYGLLVSFPIDIGVAGIQKSKEPLFFMIKVPSHSITAYV